jgi:hypothetical protein
MHSSSNTSPSPADREVAQRYASAAIRAALAKSNTRRSGEERLAIVANATDRSTPGVTTRSALASSSSPIDPRKTPLGRSPDPADVASQPRSGGRQPLPSTAQPHGSPRFATSSRRPSSRSQPSSSNPLVQDLVHPSGSPGRNPVTPASFRASRRSPSPVSGSNLHAHSSLRHPTHRSSSGASALGLVPNFSPLFSPGSSNGRQRITSVLFSPASNLGGSHAHHNLGTSPAEGSQQEGPVGAGPLSHSRAFNSALGLSRSYSMSHSMTAPPGLAIEDLSACNSLVVSRRASIAARSTGIGPVVDGVLYIGSHRDVSDVTGARLFNLRAFLCVAAELRDPLPPFVRPLDLEMNAATFKHLQLADGFSTQLHEHVAEVFTFVDDNAAAGRPVALYCQQGKSRSASFAVAYLMREYGIDSVEALELLQAIYPRAEPNFFFLGQLAQIAAYLPPRTQPRPTDRMAEDGTSTSPKHCNFGFAAAPLLAAPLAGSAASATAATPARRQAPPAAFGLPPQSPSSRFGCQSHKPSCDSPVSPSRVRVTDDSSHGGSFTPRPNVVTVPPTPAGSHADTDMPTPLGGDEVVCEPETRFAVFARPTTPSYLRLARVLSAGSVTFHESEEDEDECTEFPAYARRAPVKA